MIKDIRKLLGEDYEAFAHVVHDSILKAYLVTMEFHNPQHGHNSTTFGQCVWHSSAFFLVKGLRAALPHAIVTRPDHSLRFQIRNAAFYVSKAGHRPGENPDTFVFDQSAIRRRIAYENEVLRLFEIDAADCVVAAPSSIEQHVMIAHCGNPLDGMCRIDAGAIQPARKNESPWIYRNNMWIKKSGLVPAEEVAKLDLEAWSEKPVKELELPRRKPASQRGAEVS